MPSGRRLKAVELERNEAVRQKIAEGMDNVVDIARVLHGRPGFDDVKFSGTYNHVLRLCKREGIVLSGLPKSIPKADTTLPYKSKSGRTQDPLQVSARVRQTNGPHPVEDFIQQFPIRLPAGSAGEFDRFLKALTGVIRSVEAEAALVPELRRQIIEMQGHIKEMEARTPDVALQEEIERAREENECLKSAINRQAEQIAKWKIDNGFGGHRPLTADHLAVPPKPV